MSLYNMINGVNPATFFILPVLGKHSDEYPRFRDCFLGELSNSKDGTDQFGIPLKVYDITKKVISVYTRVGGNNREDYKAEIAELRATPTYIKDYDDDFDNTFATFQFGFPKEFEGIYDSIIAEAPLNESPDNYKEILYKVFSKLTKTFDRIFEK